MRPLTGNGFHSAPLSRQRQRSPNQNEQRQCYFLALAVAFLLASHRAFINCESLLRPAAVMPPLFARGLTVPSWPAFTFAQRARAAAAILARAAGDMRRRPLPVVICDEVVRPSNAASRFSRVSIWWRIESARSNELIDVSMLCGYRVRKRRATSFCVRLRRIYSLYEHVVHPHFDQCHGHRAVEEIIGRFRSKRWTVGRCFIWRPEFKKLIDPSYVPSSQDYVRPAGTAHSSLIDKALALLHQIAGANKEDSDN